MIRLLRALPILWWVALALAAALGTSLGLVHNQKLRVELLETQKSVLLATVAAEREAHERTKAAVQREAEMRVDAEQETQALLERAHRDARAAADLRRRVVDRPNRGLTDEERDFVRRLDDLGRGLYRLEATEPGDAR